VQSDSKIGLDIDLHDADGIRLKRSLSLAAKEKFKIVVVPREPGTERTKGVDGPAGRRIRDERTIRRARCATTDGPSCEGAASLCPATVMIALRRDDRRRPDP
jgi:hypothetical protein